MNSIKYLKIGIISAVSAMQIISAHPLMAQNIANNPLLIKSTLQYQAPQFNLIKEEHFKPAFDEGMRRHDAEIDAIANSTAKPTFINTVVALEISGQDLGRAQSVFYNLTSANTNENLQKIEEEYAPIFSAHNDKIYLNDKLFKRFKQINAATLKGEDKRLLEYYLQQFELAGANLPDDTKAKIKKINEDLATLSTQFGSKLLEARKNSAVLFNSAAELDGLSADEIATAADKAKAAGQAGKYLINIINTTQQPVLSSLKNRASRQIVYESSWSRAEKNDNADTRNLIEKMALLRMQKAQLMGKKNFAEWKLQDQIALNPERAIKLLADLSTPAVAKAKKEAADIQAIIDKQGGDFKLEPWDWSFYAEQVRKEKYAIDESEVKPYFEVTTVLEKGVFYAAKQMYGLTFKPRTDLPLYHPDVVAYEVYDKTGASIAIYYLDFYTRDTKSGGAWMNNFVNQSHYLKQKPVITNVFNFVKPAPGKASLISFDDVTTMFHEFGHSIHGLFANQKYTTLSGTATPRDFVEFPSQINEHAALDPAVLKNYAIHYQTKQPIPKELLQKILKAETFNKGYDVTELLAAAMLDLAWHTVEKESDIKPVLEFEKQALSKYGLLVPEVPTRYHTPYFNHIWGGGYSAGYYAYTWSKTLDYTAYDWFKKNGGMTAKNCDRFRKYILSVGNSVDLNKSFKTFTGTDLQVKSYISNAGL
jgi:peptidyl-dipeptidase Dcp